MWAVTHRRESYYISTMMQLSRRDRLVAFRHPETSWKHFRRCQSFQPQLPEQTATSFSAQTIIHRIYTATPTYHIRNSQFTISSFDYIQPTHIGPPSPHRKTRFTVQMNSQPFPSVQTPGWRRHPQHSPPICLHRRLSDSAWAVKPRPRSKRHLAWQWNLPFVCLEP